MSQPAHLSADEIARLRSVAATLIPGSDDSPAATDLADLSELLDRAAGALGSELPLLHDSLRLLQSEITWGELSNFATHEPVAFEIVSTVVSGAYFMSPIVLQSIGYPTGPRRAAPYGLVADELDTGILDPVIARDSMVRLPPSMTG